MTYKLANSLLNEIGNEGVIYLLDSNKYYSLNETMYQIVSGIEANKIVKGNKIL